MSPKKVKQVEPAQVKESVSETKKDEVKEVKKEEVKEVVEVKAVKPKRKCSEKQLAALAEGRKKNPRWLAKQKREEERSKELEPRSGEEKAVEKTNNTK